MDYEISKIVKYIILLSLINISLYRKSKLSLRESKFEALRIIAIVMIIAHHYSLFGFNFQNLTLDSKKLILSFFIIGGKIGVNLFIMISSYYLVDSISDSKKY